MGAIKELLKLLLRKEEEQILLDDRFEFRLNKQEKILIKKYCELKHINASEFFRDLAMKEIDNFIKSSKE